MNKAQIQQIIRSCEEILKIAKEKPEEIVGMSHENSKYNLGVNISLKRQ
jgi:hypothetical protein